MSKYSVLWESVAKHDEDSFSLSFENIENILGFPIDHSFLKYKKKLTEYGFIVLKISVKEQFVLFEKNAK